jgi:hypothetical protein
MKNQDNITPLKGHNSSITQLEDTEMVEIVDKIQVSSFKNDQ